MLTIKKVMLPARIQKVLIRLAAGTLACLFFVGLPHTVHAQTEAREPIKVDSSKVKSMAFVKLVLRPGLTSDVWVAKENLLSSLALEFKDAGYKVMGSAEEGVFSKNDASKAAMQLAGTVNHLECEESKKYRHVSNCETAVKWELLDAAKDDVVYEVLIRYRREVHRRRDIFDDEIEELIRGTLRALMARERFVAVMTGEDIVTSDGETVFPAPGFSAGEFAACPAKPMTLPSQMEDAMKASVVIRVGAGVGSGFYISEDGLLLTAAHVVSGVDSVKVKDNTGAEFTADVLRVDSKQDIALLKVQIGKSYCLSLNNTIPSIGSEIYGIGAPGGEELAFSVSRGIVSGIREWNGLKFIQTDASLNQGNSGGPLLNQEGKVIGIVSWKLAVPGFEGLGFGVPSDTAIERLAISPGSSTNISAEKEKAQVAAASSDIKDSDDPDFDSLPLIETSVQKNRIFTYKQRRLWSGGRYVLLFSGPVMMVGGSIVGILGWYKYNKATNSSGMFSPETDSWDDPKPITESDYNKYKMMNIVGWAVAGTGLVTQILFSVTGKSRTKLEAEADAAEGKTPQALAPSKPKLSVGIAGPGLTLSGTF